MRTDFSDLPPKNKHELELILRAIFDEFEEAHKLANGDRKSGRILKVILYGSMARGEAIFEPHTAKDYRSDYDILIIVNQDELTEPEYWAKLEDRFSIDHVIRGRLRHPVSIIVHTLQEVNNNLTDGRFFFLDLVKDAVVLYQSDDSELATSRPKSSADALALSREYFAEWFPSAGAFFQMYKVALTQGTSQTFLKPAAFILHQAAERLYHTLLLTCTLYTPHSHNLENLRNQGRRLDPRLVYVWPDDSKEARRRFSLLKEAYVKARYSKHYRISSDDLVWLGERVQELSAIVQEICEEHIRRLEQVVASDRSNVPGS